MKKKKMIMSVALLTALAQVSLGAVAHFNQADGDWSDSTKWSGGDIGDGTDSVRIYGGNTATLDYNESVGTLDFGNLNGSSDSGYLDISGGNTLTVAGGVRLAWSGTATTSGISVSNGTLVAASLSMSAKADSDTTLNIYSGGTVDLSGELSMGVNGMSIGSLINIDGGTVNAGSYVAKANTIIALSNGGKFVLDGDQTSLMNLRAGQGYITGAEGPAVYADGVTTLAAIPEPATLGLLACFGGAVLFVRRRFAI